MKRVLVLCDDIWHPAEVIRKGLEPLEAANPEVVFDFVETAKDILTTEMMGDYPVIFCCKGNTINAANTAPWFEPGVTEVGPGEFKEYVEKGGIYVALHAGSDVNPEWVPEGFREEAARYNELVGCRFVDHPPRCLMKVHVTNPSHPLLEGVRDFAERDEQYHLDILTSKADFFLESTTEAGGTVPCGFMFPRGKGQVIVLTPGHTLSMLKNQEYQKILQNILRVYL